jgi:hypothetical protein
VCAGMVCGKFKDAHHHWILIVLQFKKIHWNIAMP